MGIFTKKIEYKAFRPTPNMFFSGGGGLQLKLEVTYLFGIQIRAKELDREDIPHWHFVQVATLGSSEWRSKFRHEKDFK